MGCACRRVASSADAKGEARDDLRAVWEPLRRPACAAGGACESLGVRDGADAAERAPRRRPSSPPSPRRGSSVRAHVARRGARPGNVPITMCDAPTGAVDRPRLGGIAAPGSPANTPVATRVVIETANGVCLAPCCGETVARTCGPAAPGTPAERCEFAPQPAPVSARMSSTVVEGLEDRIYVATTRSVREVRTAAPRRDRLQSPIHGCRRPRGVPSG